MKYFAFVIFNLLFIITCNAQEFYMSGKKIIDFEDKYHIDSIAIVIKGLPNKIDTSFGLSKICFNIQHERTSDLKIELLAPDGTSIWLTNRNGGESGFNYLSTCFRSNGFSGYIHEGISPFSGEYIPDGRMSFLNNGQNPNGTWYLLVQDLKKGFGGIVDYVNMEFSENPMPNNDKGSCSTEHPELCKCTNEDKNCKLLPDLVILPKFTDEQIQEFPQNDISYPGQLRLAATIANIGDGPMEVLGKGEWINEKGQIVDSTYVDENGKVARQIIYQRLYGLENNKFEINDLKAGTNYFDNKPGHNHFHVDDWVVFRLLKKKFRKNGTIKATKVISTGAKVSYCLWDTGICSNSDSLCYIKNKFYGNRTLPNYGLGNFNSCKAESQGISVGGYDTYGLYYEGQFLIIPKRTKNGKYFLEIEVDPTHKYLEKDETNNIFSKVINLKLQEN